jgi:hypothetical protein
VCGATLRCAHAVVWEPFALAVIMGLLVSAAIYFIVMWPQVEPLDPEDMPATESETGTSDEPAVSSEP